MYFEFNSLLFSKFGEIDSVADLTKGVNVGERVTGGSTYFVPGGDASNLFEFVLYTPIRMVYFLFSPFPWQLRGVSDVIAMVFDSFFYITCYVYAFRALRFENKYRTLIVVILLAVLGGAFIYAWGVSNIGTAVRHRSKFSGLYAVMLGVSMMAVGERALMTKQKLKLNKWIGNYEEIEKKNEICDNRAGTLIANRYRSKEEK